MWVENVRVLSIDAPAIAFPFASVEAACGFPSPAQDYETTELDRNEHLMPNRVATFLIRARGNSMTHAGIYDGDELIVDRSISPEDGHVVDGEMTVKRLRVTPSGVILSAENRQHPNIEVAELSKLHIWGVVTRILLRVLRS
ncbi:LexA family protein [Leucobacter manosquensis]|uniref:Translesion error-prone DNA polymerase V autoproteolytic subunit n=1 Tax=Leucobacter manosquensis TaxID=2810611 RepID=A0ABS5M5H9_9MICO|nr:translesion error-prone DNA polymerase V autoproteolytic subunit [Leucobacter manosquensis]MBS3182459.1 translesion error-prone DNA polymerase V autoproteolytic subunit [Leucobacter manosquensis]